MKNKTNIEYEDIIEDISEETLLSLDELDAGTEEAIAEGKCKKEEDEETDAEIDAKLGPKDEDKDEDEDEEDADAILKGIAKKLGIKLGKEQDTDSNGVQYIWANSGAPKDATVLIGVEDLGDEDDGHEYVVTVVVNEYPDDDEEISNIPVKKFTSSELTKVKKVVIKAALDESVNEAEINSEDEFKTYAEKVLKKAHGDNYDKKKASATIEGILKKADGDYGAAIGMLTSGLGEEDIEEAVELDEDQTAVRFKQLAQTGLLDDADIAKVTSALNLIRTGKTISVAQRQLVSDTFLSLVGLVTGDSSIFTKLKQTIKKDAASTETATEDVEITDEVVIEDTEIDHSDITRLVESEEGLTEEFKGRATIIFEAAVRSKINEMKTVLQEEYDTRLIEEVEAVKENLTEKIDSYLTYAVESWVEENKVAIESSLRTEIAENFIGALKSVFVEHYIEVPESKVDLFANLEEEVNKLKEDAIEAERVSESLAAGVITLTREKIMTESFKDLADTQVEKLKSLVEDIEFVDATSYKKKIETIKEFYITGIDKDTETLQESTYDTNAYVSTETIVENENINEEDISPRMSSYLTAISRSKRASS